ncbi:N-acyl-D-amino-acid deacylase family protein [Allosphingosinicella indica]|uniref:N-acyl-D-amino-acid deacylase n=1 Tax=Allosphingosinicella indica TaxID=941907 RepID=A0A1X7GQE2_9SPHN|nr:D-aminoacylase [Allosphingosinicella indica]SMF73018.1 N-acyl-D-amino-acid deacylase [Allosphingosinicella indica]
MLRSIIALALAAASPALAADYDIIIRGGSVYDGTGAAPVAADVAVEGDRIAAIGDLKGKTADRLIDANGMAVTPGFINMLSWANVSLIQDGRSMSDIKQGVTLEVMGEGWSMGPWNDEMKAVETKGQDAFKFDIGWTSLGDYLTYMEKRGISTNIASFVGAATVRIHEVGRDNRKATPEQMVAMQDLVRQAMREGAMGVGSSLIYAPGNFADTDELVALTAAAHEFGGGYISHLRSESGRYEQAVDELLEIGRRTGAPVQIYHMKPGGQANWHKSAPMLAKLSKAREDGIDVTANIYPYIAGATGLYATMPLWVQEGGHDAWVARLKDPATRAKVIAEMRAEPEGWENLMRDAGGPEKVLLLDFKNPKLQPLTGKTLAAVAKERGTSPEDTIIDLIIEDDSRVGAAFFHMSEENIRRNIAWPWTMVGSDAGSVATEGLFLNSNPHPRAYGTFARFLGKYVRDEKVIPLPEAIRRLTALPAAQLKIKERGQLKPGFYADIVVFDPKAIADKATFEKPHQYAVGVRDVLVNGIAVLKDGEHTGAKPGRAVRGPGWTGK